jgi:hypothetical protein
MDFGPMSSNETDNGGLLDTREPRIHEADEHAIATLEEKVAQLSDEHIREP